MIGQGGFGKVYKVKYENRECVVKEFDNLELYTPADPDRNCGNSFINEILNCSVLKYNHKNLIQLLACGLDIRKLRNDDESKKGMLVMPYINGGDLSSFIEDNRLKSILQ